MTEKIKPQSTTSGERQSKTNKRLEGPATGEELFELPLDLMLLNYFKFNSMKFK